MGVTRVKICGLMSETDVRMCVEAGADSLGFVTEYPVPVPWNIDRQRARDLAEQAPPFVTTTAVVGGPVQTMVRIALTVRPHFVQLHGDETLDEIRQVCEAVRPSGTKVLKALRIDVDTGKARFDLADPVEAATVLAGSGIAGLVVDSKTAIRPAGTGVTLDWGVIGRVAAAVSLPLILAGGLTVGNVSRAIAAVHPYAVDVISGVEKAPGVKDPRRVRDFIEAAKGMGCRTRT